MDKHFAEIVIFDKEYKFLKPRAVDVIRLEDSCFGNDGVFNEVKYFNGLLGFISKNINLSTFDTEIDPIINTENKVLTLNEVGLEKKLIIENSYIKNGKIDRISYLSKILENCIEDYTIEEMSYREINEIIEKFRGKHNDKELMEVIDQITTFL